MRLKTEAEKFYAEKSFAKAHELYARAMVMSNLRPAKRGGCSSAMPIRSGVRNSPPRLRDTTKIDQRASG